MPNVINSFRYASQALPPITVAGPGISVSHVMEMVNDTGTGNTTFLWRVKGWMDGVPTLADHFEAKAVAICPHIDFYAEGSLGATSMNFSVCNTQPNAGGRYVSTYLQPAATLLYGDMTGSGGAIPSNTTGFAANYFEFTIPLRTHTFGIATTSKLSLIQRMFNSALITPVAVTYYRMDEVATFEATTPGRIG